MRYQVGDLIHIKRDDPTFDTLDDAITEALRMSFADEDSAFGVWEHDDDADLVGIAHRDEWFRK